MLGSITDTDKPMSLKPTFTTHYHSKATIKVEIYSDEEDDVIFALIEYDINQITYIKRVMLITDEHHRYSYLGHFNEIINYPLEHGSYEL